MRTQIATFCILVFLFVDAKAQVTSFFNYNDDGQRVCLVDVSVELNPAKVTLYLLDNTFNTSDSTEIYRRQMYGSGDDWQLVQEKMGPEAVAWIDNNVATGDVWEYQLRRYNANGIAYGYTCAAVLYDQSDYQGQMILVSTYDLIERLPEEVLRLKRDLTGDGWFVNEILVEKGTELFDDGAATIAIKEQIQEVYFNAPENDKPRVLFTLGHVPLPRSGQGLQAPDGHPESTGARGSDSFYADVDGVFTDTASYDLPVQNLDIIRNNPGDFKWDQDKIPSTLELAFGRINFRRVTNGIEESETTMMKNYLDRLHSYRHVLSGAKVPNIAGVNGNGYSNSKDASYRSLPALTGGENIFNSNANVESDHNPWVANNGPMKWYMSNRHVPNTSQWESIGMDALVYSSDQSNWGYGDIPNTGAANDWQASTIRRILSYDTECLIALWTTSAINVFHQVGVGEPLGVACKYIMDHNEINNNYQKPEAPWDTRDWWNRTHFNFYGDPTLRLFQTYPASELSIALENGVPTLQWTASIDESLIGYHVYKSDDEFGIFERISGDMPISGTSFEDLNYTTGDWYMVRAIASLSSGSGTFLHPSQGIFTQGDFIFSSTADSHPRQWVITPNPINDAMTIQSQGRIDECKVVDATGRLIFQQKSISDYQFEVNTESWNAGLYTILLHSQGHWTTQKVIKQ